MEHQNYFKDFEFHENGNTIIPISLGIVCEGGGELYIEFQFDEELVRRENPWVAEHVLPRLQWAPEARLTFAEARELILAFIAVRCPDPTVRRPRFWAYFADYDWVVFCRLWGKMIDLPEHFPKFCMDLQQLYVTLGSPAHLKPEKPKREHDALEDARWNRNFYGALCAYQASKLKPHVEMTRVIIESPYAGDVARNERYLRACMRDCLLRGEAPVASHGLYTQPGVLDDLKTEERAHGIAAGFTWRSVAETTVVYTDLGITNGMRQGIEHAIEKGQRVELRKLGGEWINSAIGSEGKAT